MRRERGSKLPLLDFDHFRHWNGENAGAYRRRDNSGLLPLYSLYSPSSLVVGL
jgi:hypothetical protein